MKDKALKGLNNRAKSSASTRMKFMDMPLQSAGNTVYSYEKMNLDSRNSNGTNQVISAALSTVYHKKNSEFNQIEDLKSNNNDM